MNLFALVIAVLTATCIAACAAPLPAPGSPAVGSRAVPAAPRSEPQDAAIAVSAPQPSLSFPGSDGLRHVEYDLIVANTTATPAALTVVEVLALVGLRDDPAGVPFVLTAVGLAATVVGPLLMSSRLAEPNYEVILAWDPRAVPDDWLVARAQYFRLNWIRAGLTWTALALFLAAAYLHLS